MVFFPFLGIVILLYYVLSVNGKQLIDNFSDLFHNILYRYPQGYEKGMVISVKNEFFTRKFVPAAQSLQAMREAWLLI